ncbi:collagenase-like protein with putative collagen-binding domain [Flavobacteriaceae bacterium MAR_2009_75]|nr:collagenase-like protein with putative collagen-binding domain [Flavobacteriaceae bacterium MAR_2009_75]
MKKSKELLLLAFTLLIASINAQSPWEKGKLEVSDNGHYLQHTNGDPFLWIGDTGWGMFQQLTREEIDLYLDSRQKLGFTVIQAVAHWSPHGGGMKRSPDNAANTYGHRPFAGTEKDPNTSEPLVVKGGNKNSPNDYWDNADYVIEAVKKRNMYLALLPLWAAQLITGTEQYTAEEAKTYGKFLGNRYGKEPHIIWVLGGDTKAQFDAYDKNQNYTSYDNLSIYRAMAEGIVSGVTGKSPAWNEQNPAWDEVLLTYHPNGDYPYGSSQWFHNDVWQDVNGVEVWKEVNDVYRTMLDDYQLKEPVKPSLFLEGSYEYGTYRHECGWITPVRVRRQFYQTFFAGGAGHTYGAGPIWAMRGNDGDYNCGYTWQQALDFPGARQVAEIGKEFLRTHKWNEWIPNGSVISGVGENESLKTAVTTSSKNMALVYFSNNSSCQVNNVLDGDAEAYWFYPRDGAKENLKPFKQNESRDIIPPSNWEDAVLVLKIKV